MQGVTDEKGRPKLGYYVARQSLPACSLSGLHGSVVQSVGAPILIVASNLNESFRMPALHVRLLRFSNRVIFEQETKNLNVGGNACVTEIGNLNTHGLSPDLYRIELTLKDRQGVEIARTLELFYLESDVAGENNS